jgi:Ca-activated chloride channel family protein
MAELHFLRPLWLLVLPVGAWLIWQLLRGRADAGGWRSVVEPTLRPHVLAEPEVMRDSRLALIASLAAWLVAVVALAGPAWERLPVPAFRSEEALVVALDLSRSMDAGDVEPSRLERAKLKLLDLLERRAAGQTALVVFSTHAFTVTPLTTDTRTITSLVSAVDTSIMPTQGGSLFAGLEKAAALLEQTGLNRGDILLITDSEVDEAALDLAGELASDGYGTSVLAVGTEQGAPIPRPEGGFVTDANGQVVVPQLDAASLEGLAAAGGGRFATLAPNDRDLDTLFPEPAALALEAALDGSGEEEYEADVWLDRGLVLVLVLLPLLALSFRRGWIAVWLLVVLAPLPRAEAFEWRDLWRRSDQRGAEAFEAEQPARAAELFDDPEWRSAAQYRAGQFEESAASLANVDSAASHYNRGNALAKAGQLPAAIGAYDRALELDSANEDARYNRELVAELLRDEQQQQQQQQGEGEQGQQGDSEQGESQSGEQQEGDEQQSEQGEQGESGDSQATDGSSEQPEDPDAEEQADEQDANAGAQPQEAQANSAGPEEVEQWASEQAAEQWLRRVPQDPGGLLRRKFLYQYQRLGVDQAGNRVDAPAAERRPW